MSFSPCIQNQKFIKKNFQNTSIDIKACHSHVQKELHPIEDISQNKEIGDHAYSFSDQPTNEDITVEVLGSHDSQEVSDCFHDNMLLQKVVQGLLDEEKHESSSLPLEICQAAPIYDEYNNEEAESYPSIINSDYYIPEDLVSLDTKQNDQVSFGQIPMETSKGSP